MTEVNKAALLEWVLELETTTQPQAKYALNIPGKGMCCLGVATEQFAPRLDLAKEVGVRNIRGEKREVVGYGRYGCTSMLPLEVAIYLGLDDNNTIYVTYQGERTDVTELNDNDGLTFKEIAALIRKEYDL